MSTDENKIPINRDITYFGKTNFRNHESVFGIKRKDRRQHMYVLGKSGTGKSVLLSNLIVQNINNGEGVCVVDPHGELVEDILHLIPEHRVKDVIYFNPADPDFHVGFNVIQLDDPRYKHLVASGLMGIFTKIWANAWSARMEYILNNAILALLDTPDTTMLGIPRMLVDKDYRQMIINNLKDPVVKAFWVHEYEQWRDQFRNEAIAPIQNKVGQFLSTSIIRNVVGQQRSTIDIFDIMNEGKIFLVNVSKGRIGEDNSALLGGMIITKIQLATMERVRIPENERKDFYLYVDEFQNFATDAFANILSEARKYRLNLIVAHQYTAQLETKDGGSKVRDSVFGNVGTMIIFRVGADDADFLEKEFEPEFMAQDLVNLPNYHVYLKLMIDGVTSRPFSAQTLPPLKVDLTAGVKDKIIESSRRLYTRSRVEVEDEINKWSGMLQSSEGEMKYKADCSNCKKSTMVPFEPLEGRPIYCRDCMFKIKNGELKAGTGFITPKASRGQAGIPTGALADLGIEYIDNKGLRPAISSEGILAQNVQTQKDHRSDYHDKDQAKANYKNRENIQGKQGDKDRRTFQDKRTFEKKRSGPSPLLKGLLDKIKNEGKKGGKVDIREEIKEVKKETPPPVSLSTLKKPQPKVDQASVGEKPKYESKVLPDRSASEEGKNSLKDLLSKVNAIPVSTPAVAPTPAPISAPTPTPTPVPTITPVIEKKEEKTPEVKIETPKVEESKIEEKPQPQPQQSQKQNWQKRPIKKEVPEDVLKKVLE